ncbi:MAG: hypothetical protein HOJ61_05910 [Gammaproteobacteria bacterium]|nr:hypothetical protein [Gammaproteobacteria bacterium]MBT5601751.1 hypothetical protein [Gammaproteobacteria bacterium]MBT6246100.1 hypothetical protein [Gammaproteobacteria bacterium]
MKKYLLVIIACSAGMSILLSVLLINMGVEGVQWLVGGVVGGVIGAVCGVYFQNK